MITPPAPGQSGRARVTVRITIALLVLAAPQTVTAQRRQVDLSATIVRYDTANEATSFSVAPLLEWERARTYGLLNGDVAAFAEGQWSAQGRGDFSMLLSPIPPPFHLEITGSADGSVHSSGHRTAATRAELRMHYGGHDRGLWAGGHVATGWTSATTSVVTALGPTIGGWGRLGIWTLTAVWASYQFADDWFQEAQAQTYASWGRVDVVAYLGWRYAPGSQAEGWAGGSAAVWFTPHAAVVLSGGSYPVDVLEDLPRGRYVSLAIRIADRRPTAPPSRRPGRPIYVVEHPGEEIRFSIPAARRVDVVGDWTGWQPVPLSQGYDGQWVLPIRLPPGTYRFNLVLDGKRWIVPPGVAPVDDGLGGQTGLLIVP